VGVPPTARLPRLLYCMILMCFGLQLHTVFNNPGCAAAIRANWSLIETTLLVSAGLHCFSVDQGDAERKREQQERQQYYTRVAILYTCLIASAWPERRAETLSISRYFGACTSPEI
jgi:hypothetical protein